PEAVLFGYSRLLSMDESSVRHLLSEEEMSDLEGARKVFEEKKLDLKLVRSGLSLLLVFYGYLEDRKESYEKFLDKADKNTSSEEIVKKAIEDSDPNLLKILKQGKGMSDIFEFSNILSDKKKAAEPTEEENGDKAEPQKRKTPKRIHPQQAMREKANKEAENDPENDEPVTLNEISEKIRKLSSVLFETVKGQDPAILKFVRGCFQGELFKQTENTHAPAAHFFFLGPPGVGKTLLARTAAENMGRAHKVFDMSNYSSDQSYERLVGFSKTYKDSQKGELTDLVEKNPDIVLVFDEIEKAHLKVIRLFLQILGFGRLTDAYTQKDVSFEKTIIIFTSNVGRDLYLDRSVKLSSLPERVIQDAIKNEKNQYGTTVLPPEICSRIASGNTIMFDHLGISKIAGMVEARFETVRANMKEKYNCNLTYPNSLPLLFLYKMGGGLDARVATGQSESFLSNEIYELTRQLENQKDTEIKSIRFDIERNGMSEELKKLFVCKDKMEVLVFASEEIAGCFGGGKSRFKIHRAGSIEEATELLKHDIMAIFIDPRFGLETDETGTLSITDYYSEGNAFFRQLVRINDGTPLFILDTQGTFSAVDKMTYCQEGAEDTININPDYKRSFSRQFVQIMEELYMERESSNFSQKGWVIDFGTKQIVNKEKNEITILFYDLRKSLAVDSESRDLILSDAEKPDVRFDDVIGAKKAKDELRFFVEYLKNPKQFVASGGKPPKGVLLYGPPGTGKTMLAKAMAGESDVTFIQTSAAEFKNPYVGASEQKIRDVFKKAKQYAPAIIFIDEIDAIGKKRTGNDTVTEGILNALLTEMDGFATDNRKPVFVLAATNYGVGGESEGIAELDEALVRRFDNSVYVALPNLDERKTFLSRLIENRKDISVSEDTRNNIADRTTGQSLAILQNVFDLAIRNSIKEHEKVNDSALLTALEEYLHGEKKEHDLDYYKKVAIHETGHAYVSYLSGETPSYITIESRGNFGGYMQHANSEEKTEYTREEMLSLIRTSLAGRAAEQVFFGREKSINTGASSDLANATRIAFRMICSYGMEEDQYIVLSREEIMLSPLAAEYVRKANDIVKEEMEKTIGIIEKGRKKIQAIADVLVKENRLTGEQFEKLMKGRKA
ncbi:MAG: AAA family ATPase, partial [Lachnospiraceae bacterium]|nr:AAA family ATPase [Lachnospiraceae bacterium]